MKDLKKLKPRSVRTFLIYSLCILAIVCGLPSCTEPCISEDRFDEDYSAYDPESNETEKYPQLILSIEKTDLKTAEMLWLIRKNQTHQRK